MVGGVVVWMDKAAAGGPEGGLDALHFNGGYGTVTVGLRIISALEVALIGQPLIFMHRS